MGYYWTDEDIRLPIETRYSCCENGGWLFERKRSSVHCSTSMVVVLHDKGEWKNFESISA